MNTTDIPIDDLPAFHLANARRIWRDLVSRAEKDSWGYGDFLSTLVVEESRIASRRDSRLADPACTLSFLKTIDDFDFTLQSTLRLFLLGFLRPTSSPTDAG
ncbi:MAG: ATP-binding protein [Labilithrix sp.]